MTKNEINIEIRGIRSRTKTAFGEIFIENKIIAYFIELPTGEFSVIDTEGDTMFIAESLKEAGLKTAVFLLENEGKEDECDCPLCQISRQVNLMH
ncbi:AbrB family transcriptional regulator [Escherichia coli]|uniref:AbrB family transcriptional regulator n=1 Tax=Escherichia coli TaxID=562 RepID=UPI0030F3A298